MHIFTDPVRLNKPSSSEMLLEASQVSEANGTYDNLYYKCKDVNTHLFYIPLLVNSLDGASKKIAQETNKPVPKTKKVCSGTDDNLISDMSGPNSAGE